MLATHAIGFWEGFLLLLIFLPLAMLWVFALFDLFRRTDLSGVATALWLVAILLFPLIGTLIYFIVRPVTERDKQVAQQWEAAAEAQHAANVADKLHKLSELRDKGDLTQEEFEAQKAKLLS